MKRTLGLENPPHELSSPTLTANNSKIGVWGIHRTAGVSAGKVVEAASNRRTSEAVPLKRLVRKNSAGAQKASKVMDIYSAFQCIKNHEYGHFAMRLRCLLNRHETDWRGTTD